MGPSVLPFAVYVLVSTFTPGPNNILAASAGVALGYRRSLRCLAGMVAGFTAVLLLAGYFNYALHSRFAEVSLVIKWIGFVYLLWLSISLFLHAEGRGRGATAYTFVSGALLQLVNPKLILYGITLFGMFPALLSSFWTVLLASAGLALVGFAAISTWCLIGSTLNRWLGERRNRLVFNVVLALLLLYTAFSILLE